MKLSERIYHHFKDWGYQDSDVEMDYLSGICKQIQALEEKAELWDLLKRLPNNTYLEHYFDNWGIYDDSKKFELRIAIGKSAAEALKKYYESTTLSA